MKEYDIQNIYRYFELLKESNKLEKEIKDVVAKNTGIDMEYGTWLVGIVELEKKYDEKREEFYLEESRERAYQQNNCFLWQKTQFEDDYYGCIYYPLKDNKYLKIDYSC